MNEQIPFEGNEDQGFDEDPIELSPAVEAIVAGEDFAALSVDELVELAQCAIEEAVGVLIEPLAEEEAIDQAIDQAAVIAATQLECAATILATVDLGDEDEDEVDDEDDREAL